MANSVDPNEMPLSAASHLGLHCLLRPVCPNAYGKYGTQTAKMHRAGFSLLVNLHSIIQSTLIISNSKAPECLV